MASIRRSIKRAEGTRNFSEKIGRILERFGDDELDLLLEKLEPYRTEADSMFNLYKPVENPVNKFSISMLYHCSPAQIRAIIAANRSSKTFSSMEDMIISFTGNTPKSLQGWIRFNKNLKNGYEITHTEPPENIGWQPIIPEKRIRHKMTLRWVATDTPKGLWGVAIPMFFKLCPEDELEEFHNRALIAYSKSGCEFEFMACSMYIDAFRGKAVHRVHFDEEPVDIEYYTENRKRIISTEGEITFSMTPERGITWVHSHIYRRAYKLYRSVENVGEGIYFYQRPCYTPDRKLLIDTHPENKDLNVEVFHPTIYDNQYIKLKEIEQTILEHGPDSNATKITVLGEFISMTGRVFHEFSDKHICTEKWVKENCDPKFPRFIAIDCHTEIPFAGVMACVMPDETVIIEKEFWLGGAPEVLFPDIIDWEKEPVLWADVEGGAKTPQQRWIVWRIMDPLGNVHERSSGLSLFDMMRGEPYHIAVRPWKRHKYQNHPGILQVRDALQFHKNLFGQETAKLYVCECCPKTIKEFQEWIYEPWGKKIVDKHNPKDRGQDKDDHYMQCITSLYMERGFTFMREEEEDATSDWEEVLAGD